MEQDRWD